MNSKYLFYSLLFMLLSCNDQAEKEAFMKQLTDKDSTIQVWKSKYEQLDNFLAEITSQIQAIDIGEEMVQLEASQGTNREKLLERIDAISKYIEATKSRMAHLEHQAGKANGFRNLTKKLKKLLAEKEDTIKQLKAQVSALESDKVNLQDQLLNSNNELMKAQNQVRLSRKAYEDSTQQLSARLKASQEEAQRMSLMIDADNLAFEAKSIKNRKDRWERYYIAYKKYLAAASMGIDKAKEKAKAIEKYAKKSKSWKATTK